MDNGSGKVIMCGPVPSDVLLCCPEVIPVDVIKIVSFVSDDLDLTVYGWLVCFGILI